MRRRLFLLAAWTLRADTRQEVYDLFTGLAADLAAGNTIAFLARFDRTMPEIETLRTYLTALVEQFDVLSSIDLLSFEENQAELDWFLQLTRKGEVGRVERRRERVHCRLEREKKKWRITALTPVAFFRPPQV